MKIIRWLTEPRVFTNRFIVWFVTKCIDWSNDKKG